MTDPRPSLPDLASEAPSRSRSEPRRGETTRALPWTILFGVTMGIFEAAVVVYLNRLQALGALDLTRPRTDVLLVTEVVRETASLLMILSVACLAGRGAVA